MSSTLNTQLVNELVSDMTSFAHFMYKPAGFKVERRLAPTIDTLQFYINRFNSLNGDFSSSVSVALSSLNNSVAEAEGKVDYIETTVQDAINQSILSSGFVTVDSFELGATLTQRNQALRHAVDGKLYRWAGDLPKVVPVSSTPASSGGIGDNGWLEVSDATLRQDIVTGGLVTDAAIMTVPITSTAGEPRKQLDKNRESVSALDFFTQAELNAYNAATTTFDASRPLQEFFDYITNNKVGIAYCTGYFSTSKTLTWGGKDSETKCVVGSLELIAQVDTPMDAILKIQPGRYCNWVGGIVVSGRGSTDYSMRTVNRGIVFGGEHSAAHFTISGSVEANRGFKYIGIHVDDFCTGANLGALQATRCGSGNPVGVESLSATFSNRVDAGGDGFTQSSKLTVSTLPPENLPTALLATINGHTEAFFVDGVDRVNSTISLKPRMPADITTGELRYVFGAGVYVTGADTSAIKIGKISGTNNGVVAWLASLYLPVVDNLTAESNFTPLAIGNSLSSANVGGQINGLYTEHNQFDLVRISRFIMNLPILCTYEFNPNKIAYPHVIRGADGEIDKSKQDLNGISIQTTGYLNTYQGKSNNIGGALSLDVTSPNRLPVDAWGNDATINITEPNMGLHDAYGYSTREVLVTRTVGNGTPIGSVTFNAPIGYTVNGLSSVVYSGFTAPPRFTVSFITKTKNFIITSSQKSPLQSVTAYKFPTLAAGATQSKVITLSGVSIGDTVVASYDKPLMGTQIWCEVTATNSVTVYHKNDTAAPVDVVSGNIKVKLI